MNKMYYSFKNVVRNTIDLEFHHVQEGEFKHFDKVEEYKKTAERCSEIYHILCDNLPEELHHLVEEFDCKKTDLMCDGIQYYFKKGVISGLTNLKYLEEFGEAIIIL
jgi:hypothetical protein